jgi:hypothetical protein
VKVRHPILLSFSAWGGTDRERRSGGDVRERKKTISSKTRSVTNQEDKISVQGFVQDFWAGRQILHKSQSFARAWKDFCT